MEVVGLLLRVACVFGLLFLALHLLRRTNGIKNARRASVLQVLGSTRIGKGAALTVVRIGDSDYVLGVTDHAVTLIAPATPTAEPGAVPVAQAAPEPVAAPGAADVGTPTGARPDFAAALGARLGSMLATGSGDPLQVPPTPAEFLRSAYRVARRRPAESTELSTDAVTAALASVRGDEAPAAAVPAPRTSTENSTRGSTPDSPLTSTPPVATDGPAAPTSRHALRRAVARTEALRHEEHLWTRSCRPTCRTATPGGALV